MHFVYNLIYRNNPHDLPTLWRLSLFLSQVQKFQSILAKYNLLSKVGRKKKKIFTVNLHTT